MPTGPALIIFIKNPIPGRTKTRLAASVGHDMALRMYGVLTNWTREQALGLSNVTRYLYYSEFIPSDDGWSATDFLRNVQRGSDLGARMENAVAEVFERGHDRVIIIGTDCPGITTEYLKDAFVKLADYDVVIGPALDGGYTLLGMRGEPKPLFNGVEWSTESVLAQTLALVEQFELQPYELTPLSDVDYLEDWQSYGWSLPL